MILLIEVLVKVHLLDSVRPAKRRIFPAATNLGEKIVLDAMRKSGVESR